MLRSLTAERDACNRLYVNPPGRIPKPRTFCHFVNSFCALGLLNEAAARQIVKALSGLAGLDMAARIA